MARRKASTKAPSLPPWWPTGFVPCVATDAASVAGGRFARVYMLAPTFEGTLAVQEVANMPGTPGVRDRVIPAEQVRLYSLVTDEEKALHSSLEELKLSMLKHGATREAVRLVGEHIPFSKKELETMAEKLKRKAPAKKAPAKKAPTAEKKTPAKRGPKTNEPDTRKITVVKKEHGAREGTKRAAMLDTIYASKTAQEALDGGVTKGEIAWAAREGYIMLK